MLILPPVFSSAPTTHRRDREGVVLLIVIAMLALFASVALSFVFYAEATATASSYFIQSQTAGAADIEPELLLSYFLGQLIYDTANEYSVLRGHSLARTKFGANNNVPFNGTGRLRYPLGPTPVVFPPGVPDNYQAINYQYHDADNFFRDPERYGFRIVKTDPLGQQVGEGGAPWTYPDLDNVFLAAVNASGEVLLPSYTRPWTQAPTIDPVTQAVTFDPLAPANQKWLKYLTMRPHSSYHPLFITPDSENIPGIGILDVKNLDWARGVPYIDPVSGLKKYSNNDSPWLDMGWPVMIAPDGRRYKALVAPLIMDLDNRVNLWAAGGLRKDPVTGNYLQLIGNQGWGRWEINPQHVFPPAPPALANEWYNLFTGVPGVVAGRYGLDGIPNGPNPLTLPLARWFAPWYAPYDFDGNGAGRIGLPAAGSLFGFPNSSQPWGTNWDSGGATTELVNHPYLYNYLNPLGDDVRRPALSNLEAQLRLGGKGATGFTSDLFKLLPQNFLSLSTANTRTRNLSTFLSFDVNRPGLVPFWTKDPSDMDPLARNPYEYNAVRGYPVTASVPFPTMAAPPPPPGPPHANSEFGANWRSRLAQFPQRVKLNRALPEYPKKLFQDPTDPANLALQRLLAIDPANAADAMLVQEYKDAVADRQAFAAEIYRMLMQMTGATDPTVVVGIPTTDPRHQAARWLAQLAVNIVDYIDNDDYQTPYLWYRDPAPANTNDTTKWETLYGTELPKLVINEFYAQLDNNPLDATLPATATTYKVNCWLELHNPFKDTPSGNVKDFPLDRGEARLKIDFNTLVPGVNAYRILITRADASLRSFDNLTGTPSPAPGNVIVTMDEWADNANTKHKVHPGNGNYAIQGPPGLVDDRGFFAVGPTMSQFGVDPYIARKPNLPLTYATDRMAGIVPANDALNPVPTELVTILQRLACPYLPHDNTPAMLDTTDPLLMRMIANPLYNPYITVDIMDGLTISPPADPARGYYDGRLVDALGPVAVAPAAPTAWATWGRRQPYAGIVNHHALQNPLTRPVDPITLAPHQPKHTFFRHNAREDAVINAMTGVDNTTQPAAFHFMTNPAQTLFVPDAATQIGDKFHWLLHTDRLLLNPLELLHVCAFRNHELTQRFFDSSPKPLPVPLTPQVYTGAPHKHYAPWFTSDSLLYRFLEMSYTPEMMNGINEGGRTPGKININTIWDIEVFRALCNANATVNGFTPTDIDNLWNNLFLPSRTPSKLSLTDPTIQIRSGDRPFWPFGIGYTAGAADSQYPNLPNGLDLQKTMFRDGPTPGSKLFFRPGSHPVQEYELLTKLHTNVTMRSNCFAVYLTVGFFEVVDDTARPVKLGAELGRAEGRHIRHRMFALVDRSTLSSNPGPRPTFTTRNEPTSVPYFVVID